MKKTTSVIALILLATLLFTGCDSSIYDAFAPAANQLLTDCDSMLYDVFAPAVNQLSGDDLLPITQDYSQYGFTFRIIGNASLYSNNHLLYGSDYYEFLTKYEILRIYKISKAEAQRSEEFVSESGYSKEVLDQNKRVYTKEFEYKEDVNPIRIATCCFVDTEEYVWLLQFNTIQACYNADEILEVCKSFRLVDPS